MLESRVPINDDLLEESWPYVAWAFGKSVYELYDSEPDFFEIEGPSSYEALRFLSKHTTNKRIKEFFMDKRYHKAIIIKVKDDERFSAYYQYDARNDIGTISISPRAVLEQVRESIFRNEKFELNSRSLGYAFYTLKSFLKHELIHHEQTIWQHNKNVLNYGGSRPKPSQPRDAETYGDYASFEEEFNPLLDTYSSVIALEAISDGINSNNIDPSKIAHDYIVNHPFFVTIKNSKSISRKKYKKYLKEAIREVIRKIKEYEPSKYDTSQGINHVR